MGTVITRECDKGEHDKCEFRDSKPVDPYDCGCDCHEEDAA